MKSFRENLEDQNEKHQYCNRVFGGWDYALSEEGAALLKHRSLYKDLVVSLQPQIKCLPVYTRSKDLDAQSEETAFLERHRCFHFKLIVKKILLMSLCLKIICDWKPLMS